MSRILMAAAAAAALAMSGPALAYTSEAPNPAEPSISNILIVGAHTANIPGSFCLTCAEIDDGLEISWNTSPTPGALKLHEVRDTHRIGSEDGQIANYIDPAINDKGAAFNVSNLLPKTGAKINAPADLNAKAGANADDTFQGIYSPETTAATELGVPMEEDRTAATTFEDNGAGVETMQQQDVAGMQSPDELNGANLAQADVTIRQHEQIAARIDGEITEHAAIDAASSGVYAG